MEKSSIYASAPKPPKQIRVEEDTVETNTEKQDLPEQPEQSSKITVMQPTVSKDTVVKLNTEKSSEPVLNEKNDEAPNVNSVSTEGLASKDENLGTDTQTETLAEQTVDPERNSTEEQLELGEIETTENTVLPFVETIETEAIQIPEPEKNSTDEQIELHKVETAEDLKPPAVETTDAEILAVADIEKDTAEEQTELAEIEAKTDDEPTGEKQNDEGDAKVEEPYNIDFETNIKEVGEYLNPTEIDEEQPLTNNEAKKVAAETKPPTEKGLKPSKQKAEVDHEFENLKIPGDDELFQRQYYSMGEVATMFHANQSQIRFWENEFDILQPKKNKKGDRYFRPEDVKNLQVIHHLLRNRRFTIEGAREYLKSNKQRTQDTIAAITSLNQIKSFLTELKANL